MSNNTFNIIEKLNKINSPEDIKNSILKPYKEILDNSKEVYIFGAKKLGQKLYYDFVNANIKVLGFIDNNPQLKGTSLFGCNIFSIDDLISKKNEITIIVASINYMYEITEQLKNMGFQHIIPYSILTLYNKEFFSPEMTFENLHNDLIQNKAEYINFYNKLADEDSKIVLNGIINFRLTFNFLYLHGICKNSESEYFEDNIIELNSNEIFIDGGGYNGDTALKFIKNVNGNYKEIYFFEPDKDSFYLAKQNLNSFKNILFFNKGLYSDKGTVKFSDNAELGSFIDSCGNTEISVDTLDNIVNENSTFIKLDVEGAEIEALKGALKNIKSSPKLAISVYHRPSDMWKIPELILSINPNYKFYLRHYTKTVFDTILYAIPIF